MAAAFCCATHVTCGGTSPSNDAYAAATAGFAPADLFFFQSFLYTASEIAAAISIWEDAVDAGVDLPSALGIGHAFRVGRWRWPLEQRKRRWPTPRRPAGRQEALGCPRCHATESSYVVGYLDGIHAGRRKRTWHSRDRRG